MSARDQILAKLRKRTLPIPALPSHDGPWITYADKVTQFSTVLSTVGGHAVRVDSQSEALSHLAQLPVMSKARRVVSLLSGVDQANVDLKTVSDPHTLEDVDVTIVKGQFGVAENGAVWITDDTSAHRASLFICQHLVILLPIADLIDNMHQAYERIGAFGPGFGVFVSGPSKTADIEQSLVIGAHGARSATLYLLQNDR